MKHTFIFSCTDNGGGYHDIKPCDIQIENRIYQNYNVLIANPTCEDIDPIIEKIKELDRVVREVKLGETA